MPDGSWRSIRLCEHKTDECTISETQIDMEQSEQSLTDDSTIQNMKPELLANLPCSSEPVRLSKSNLKGLLISMERMEIESVLIGQISLSP